MKKQMICIFIFLLSLTTVAREHWEYFAHSNNMTAIDFNNETVWIGTGSGIIEYNRNTKQYVKYDYRDGLDRVQVKDIAVDQTSGLVWCLISKPVDHIPYQALYSFDGSEWTKYFVDNSLVPSDQLNAIAVDSKGVLYIGSDYGLTVYDHGDWWSRQFDGGNRQVLSIKIDKDDIKWLGMSNGLYRFGDYILNEYKIGTIYTLDIDKNGDVWCGTWFNGIQVVSGDSVIEYTTKNSDLPFTTVKKIVVDDENNKWIYSYDAFSSFSRPEYLSCLNADNVTWQHFTSGNSVLPSSHVQDMKIDNDHALWIATTNGLVRIAQNQWYNVPLNGMVTNSFNGSSIVFDQNEDLWVGGSGGVSHLIDDQWANYVPDNSGLVTNDVFSIAIDQDNGVWVSTVYSGKVENHGYISHFNGQEWTVYDGSSNNVIKNSYIVDDLIFDHENRLWFIKDGKMAMVENNIWSDVRLIPDVNTPHARDLFVDARGDIWVATWYGVFQYTGGEWLQHNTENSALNTDIIYTIRAVNSSDVWAHTREGVSHFNGAEWENHPYPADYEYEYLVNHNEGFAVDSTGLLWVYTTAGLFTFNDGEWNKIDTTSDGAPLYDVINIIVDKNDNKWFCTNSYGLMKLGETYTGIEEKEPKVISEFQVQQNYPNPFNATTTLTWELAVPGHVNISIYNTLGQLVATLVDGYQGDQGGSIKWHGRDDHGNMVTSGIYFARLTTGDVVKTIKMAFVE